MWPKNNCNNPQHQGPEKSGDTIIQMIKRIKLHTITSEEYVMHTQKWMQNIITNQDMDMNNYNITINPLLQHALPRHCQTARTQKLSKKQEATSLSINNPNQRMLPKPKVSLDPSTEISLS